MTLVGLKGILISVGLLTRVCCTPGPLLPCVVVETQARCPSGQAAVPPGSAPAPSSGPVAAMVLLHTLRGLGTVSHLPADRTPQTT